MNENAGFDEEKEALVPDPFFGTMHNGDAPTNKKPTYMAVIDHYEEMAIVRSYPGRQRVASVRPIGEIIIHEADGTQFTRAITDDDEDKVEIERGLFEFLVKVHDHMKSIANNAQMGAG